MAGDTRTAATVFQLVEALDAGPVYASDPYDIDPEATAGEVLADMAVRGADTVLRVVDALADGSAVRTRDRRADLRAEDDDRGRPDRLRGARGGRARAPPWRDPPSPARSPTSADTRV